MYFVFRINVSTFRCFEHFLFSLFVCSFTVDEARKLCCLPHRTRGLHNVYTITKRHTKYISINDQIQMHILIQYIRWSQRGYMREIEWEMCNVHCSLFSMHAQCAMCNVRFLIWIVYNFLMIGITRGLCSVVVLMTHTYLNNNNNNNKIIGLIFTFHSQLTTENVTLSIPFQPQPNKWSFHNVLNERKKKKKQLWK